MLSDLRNLKKWEMFINFLNFLNFFNWEAVTMDTRNVKREYFIKQWEAIFADRLESGLTINDYCERNNLSRNTYFYWLKIVRAHELGKQQITSTSGLVELTGNDNKLEVSNPVSCTPLPEVNYDDSLTVTINGATIHVDGNTSSALLKRVIEVLADVK